MIAAFFAAGPDLGQSGLAILARCKGYRGGLPASIVAHSARRLTGGNLPPEATLFLRRSDTAVDRCADLVREHASPTGGLLPTLQPQDCQGAEWAAFSDGLA